MRLPLVALLGLSSGCFIDALGESTTSQPGSGGSTVTEAGGSTASAQAGGNGGQGATGGAGGAQGGGSSDGGGGGGASAGGATQGGGGEGGDGGAGGAPCEDSALSFDGDDLATITYDAAFDFTDNFAIGAWIMPEMDPRYAVGNGDARSRIIGHTSPTEYQGYHLSITELNDDGVPHIIASIQGNDTGGNGTECVVASAPIAWGTWLHVAVLYNNQTGNDLHLFLNGAEVSTKNCSSDLSLFAAALYNGPLSIGNDAGIADRGFLGLIDDVFVRSPAGGTTVTIPQPPNPVTCGTNDVAAYAFDESLASECPAPALVVGLAATPADPEFFCTVP